MDLFQFLSVVGFPLLIGVGGIAAWRVSKRNNGGFVEAPKATQWRDESLDDWRSRRDNEIEAERQARVAVQPSLQETTGADSGETKRHQRIGG